jgi:hypothetical protein
MTKHQAFMAILYCFSKRVGGSLVMKYFFEFSTFLRCVNATRIALVPKVENLVTMNDFRPISCCNVMYKCITKVIMSKLQLILPYVIGPSQTAFMSKRHILYAILLT